MYQLPHHHQCSSGHLHHQQPTQPGHPFSGFYLSSNAPVATEQAGVQRQGGVVPTAGGFNGRNSSYYSSHPAAAREVAPAGKPSGRGSRKSTARKAAGRKKSTEPLRGMGVEQLEQHLRLQEAAAAASSAAAASASCQKRLLLPKFKSAKKPGSRTVHQQEAGFPDEHYGTPVEYGVPVAAVTGTERHRQLQLLQQYQAWVRRITGGGQPAGMNVTPYAAGAGRSSTAGKATAGGGSAFLHQDETSASELSSIPKLVTAFNNNDMNSSAYDDLPTCRGPCCLERKNFVTAMAATGMVQKNSGVVITRERFQEAAKEAPLINSSSSSSSNYHRLPAGLMMSSVENAGVNFTRQNMEAITSPTTGFCRSIKRVPFYPYHESNYLDPLAKVDEVAELDDAQRNSSVAGNGGSGHGMGVEYYEFFPIDKTSSGEIAMKGGSVTKEECSDQEDEEGAEVEDYPGVGYCGGGEASCLTTSDHHRHHHHEQYYSSSSAYSYTLASNPSTTTVSTTTNSISSSLDLSLKLSF